ncbi:unnamed protein product [Parnassius apollo]|uniref:(apollo) hypothetical protein n=1 Tax=Parnassius apollo TaxID=110799 RepID=A0A8S3W7T0_PARAO|nr:unnamed protein product [Parnassius apollo]
MPRLNDEDIRNYLENLDDSEDGLDGSESESDEEDTYYQAAREVFRDLEGSDCEERHIGENIQSPSSNQLDDDMDHRFIMETDQHLQEPTSSSHRPTRPIVWRQRNLITREEDLKFQGNTQLPEELTQRETPLDFFTYFFTPDLIKHTVEQNTGWNWVKLYVAWGCRLTVPNGDGQAIHCKMKLKKKGVKELRNQYLQRM